MKWPIELLLIRHAESAYNNLKKQKEADPEYRRFRTLLENDPSNPEIQPLAVVLHEKHALGCSDRDTPITAMGETQARATGRGMRESGVNSPHVIFVSPYLRTEQTLRILQEEWPGLRNAAVYREERIREKDHGLALLYNDSHIYFLMHPEQAELYKLLGDYDYRFLNGENIPDVRQRNLSWIATMTREFAGKRVMAITHHLTILATRANFERLSPKEFLHLDKHEKPLNCGVTRYIGNPNLGSRGKLELCEYNRQYDQTARIVSTGAGQTSADR
jgi:broad specificity phosphatase PhoE